MSADSVYVDFPVVVPRLMKMKKMQIMYGKMGLNTR
jgi:hypothetical protein